MGCYKAPGKNMDYSSYDTLTTTTSTSDGAAAGVGLGLILAYFAVAIFMLVAMWKVYTKAGRPGWAPIIPIYGTLVMLWMIGRPWWWLLLMLIPFVGIIFAIIATNDLSKSFGKSVGWTVGLIFLPFIFYPMLAFGDAKYAGPVAVSK
ncbi:MAG TPA: DUF5684 domain-containing protein [Candidatus Saccharimonadales bacterium]